MHPPPPPDNDPELIAAAAADLAGLRAPSAAARSRAQPLFEQIVRTLQANRPGQGPGAAQGIGPLSAPEAGPASAEKQGPDAAAEPSPSRAGSPALRQGPEPEPRPGAAPRGPVRYGRGRRYDLALAVLLGPTGSAAETTSAGGWPTTAAPAGQTVPILSGDTPAASAAAAVSPPARPPAHAPQIRASVRRPPPSPARELPPAPWVEESTSSLLRILEDGAQAFDLAFTDPTLGPITCTITVRAGLATATFYAADADTRRLLDAEAGRLRVMLEARGLRVAAVTIQPAPGRG